MLQEAITAPIKESAHVGPPSMMQPKALGKPSAFIRGIPATLRQTSLGKEIKSTLTESATANQLPQSGIHKASTAQLFAQPSFLIGFVDSNPLPSPSRWLWLATSMTIPNRMFLNFAPGR